MTSPSWYAFRPTLEDVTVALGQPAGVSADNPIIAASLEPRRVRLDAVIAYSYDVSSHRTKVRLTGHPDLDIIGDHTAVLDGFFLQGELVPEGAGRR